VTEPGFAGSSTNAVGTERYRGTLKQVFTMARITCGSLPMVAVLLLFVTWVMSQEGGFEWTTLGEFRPVLVLILAAGLAIAASSSFVRGSMGRRAAEKWAAAGGRADGVAAEGPQADQGLGYGMASAVPPSLWMRFFMACVVGCALPEALLLAAFVVTIASDRGIYLLVATTVYLPLWALSFPRRATWDSWAALAGVTLPWDGPGAGTVAQAPVPKDLVVPR
jgi:hypothetical protein